ncbi:protein mono-ADP-ribosyltransferase PARP11-like isoform X2 [Genypterus blacodes]|uniref:protein mono-ADP-ribosyltransferase PARP11-like isoform X2 n=1 Tax=Genypterus blacodes TaxID=154954 RepID=UPI003F77393A
MDTNTLRCWYYLAQCGRWHRFEDDPSNSVTSGNIEELYQRDPKGVLQISFSRMDFSAMLQTDLSTGMQRRIKRGDFNPERRCCCFDTAPVFWETPAPGFPYQLVPLYRFSPEFQTVTDYMKHDGLLDRTVLSVHRIQNLDLWELYCRKRIQLMRIQGVGEIKEMRLFHGTKKRYVHNICTYNFDFRLAAVIGIHLYGKGTYFARHASYADKYSESSSDRLPVPGPPHGHCSRIVFVARVMVGRFHQGQVQFHKPDDGTLENAHESCVDNVNNPNIFVIFDPNQIYPEYLIEYC